MVPQRVKLAVALAAGGLILVLLLAVWMPGEQLALVAWAASCSVPGGKATIQAAINDPTCDTIVVAAGTYHERLIIRRTLALQGAGPASTVIHGGGAGVVISITQGAKPTIAGFTITGGDGSTNNGQGGGISILGASAIIRNNVISGNVASHSPGTFGEGGGVFVMTSTSPVLIEGNVIQYNRAYSVSTPGLPYVACGGGIALERVAAAIISGNQILANVAASVPVGTPIGAWGGGICAAGNDVTIQRNLVQSNWANAGSGVGSGGGMFLYRMPITITDNILTGNTAVYHETSLDGEPYASGGGIAFQEVPRALLDGNWVMTNTAALTATSSDTYPGAWAGGGGISYYGAARVNDVLRIQNNHILGNRVAGWINVSGDGALGVAEGGGMWIQAATSTLVLNNEVIGNMAVQHLSQSGNGNGGGRGAGGGMYLSQSDSIVLDGNQIRSNIAAFNHTANELSANNDGGGIGFDNVANLTMTNNTLRSNVALWNGRITSNSGSQMAASGGGVSGYNGDVDGTVTMIDNVLLQNETVHALSKNGSDVGAYAYAGGVFVGGRTNLLFRTNIVSGNMACQACGGDSWSGGLDVADGKATLQANLFYANRYGQGLSVRGAVVTSTNDIFARNADGVSVHDGGTASLIHATLYRNDNSGVTLWGDGHLVLVNSIVYLHQIGLDLDPNPPASSVSEDYNLLDNTSNYNGPIAPGSHTIPGQDPRLVNPAAGDFHLLSTSPAIDAANDALAPPTDYYGNHRPRGAHADIGAAEYVKPTVYVPTLLKQ